MIINGYKLEIVCANVTTNGSYGDIYTHLQECIAEHPNEEIRFGFYLDKSGKYTPDWFDTIDDAVAWASQN